MDDILVFNPSSFRMLRAFWKLSFIKIDEQENKALRDIILIRNEKFLNGRKGIFPFDKSLHEFILTMVGSEYLVDSSQILKYSSSYEYIRHEMAIEAGIIDIVSAGQDSVFGNWDYISHQVVASPFKPIDYMDKMDIFGYKRIKNFDTISKYLVIEIKKDNATKENIDQIMKYVDWINQEYSCGDYSMIEAYLVAYEFPQEVIKYKKRICIRNYTKGRRPAISDTWVNVKLIKYRSNDKNNKLDFEEIK